jgi:diguanylate cyclase (GGDEF)-like protein
VRHSRAGYTDQPFGLGTQLHLYAASVDSLLSAPTELLVPENPHLRHVLVETSGSTAELLEAVIEDLMRATDADLRRSGTIARAMFAGKLVSLLLLGLLLFEPMVAHILYKRDMLLKANQELARVSATDGLTQAANRRAFEERLDEEWRRASRDAVPMTLLMIDIDHFKAYNDRYGHQAGDECLKLITRDFRIRLRRPADFLARYGGEEFAIILPDTDLSGALVVAEDLRRRTMALEIAHGASPVAGVVTLSIGVAEAEPAANNWSAMDLVAASDRALYRAKRLGRNRVITTTIGPHDGGADDGRGSGQIEEQQNAGLHDLIPTSTRPMLQP